MDWQAALAFAVSSAVSSVAVSVMYGGNVVGAIAPINICCPRRVGLEMCACVCCLVCPLRRPHAGSSGSDFMTRIVVLAASHVSDRKLERLFTLEVVYVEAARYYRLNGAALEAIQLLTGVSRGQILTSARSD